MSRSYKHAPIHSNTTAHTQKEWKRDNNRTLRSKEKRLSHRICQDPYQFEDVIYPIMREVSNIYDSPSDGRSGYWRGKFVFVRGIEVWFSYGYAALCVKWMAEADETGNMKFMNKKYQIFNK